MTDFKQIQDPSIVQLCQNLKQSRNAGITHCELCEMHPALDGFTTDMQSQFNADLTPIIDAFVMQQGFKPLANLWYQVNDETAKWILECVLSVYLGYSRMPVEGSKKAPYLTDQFIKHVKRSHPDERLRYFTNGKAVPGPAMYDISMRHMMGWNPISSKDMVTDDGVVTDSGVIMISRYRIGMIWVEDMS